MNTISEKNTKEALEHRALQESITAARAIKFRALTSNDIQEIREELAERAELTRDVEKLRKVCRLLNLLEGVGSAILISVGQTKEYARPRSPRGVKLCENVM